MTTIPKNPTHKDNIYHIYLDAQKLYIKNILYSKIKRFRKRFIIIISVISVLLYAYLYFNQYDRITTCERLSLDTPVHCTIVHKHKFRGDILIMSKDIGDVVTSTFDPPNGSTVTIYDLKPLDGSKEQQIKGGEYYAYVSAFSAQVESLLSETNTDRLPETIEIVLYSDHKLLIYWTFRVHIFLMLFVSFVSHVMISRALSGSEYISISRKDGNITFDDDERYPLSLIRRVEIKKEESDYSRLTIYLSGTNKTISMLGKNVLLQQQIKSMLEQWAKEAKLADQNKQ